MKIQPLNFFIINKNNQQTNNNHNNYTISPSFSGLNKAPIVKKQIK